MLEPRRQLSEIRYHLAAYGRTAAASHRKGLLIHRRRVIVANLLSPRYVAQGDQLPVVPNPGIRRTRVVGENSRRLRGPIKALHWTASAVPARRSTLRHGGFRRLRLRYLQAVADDDVVAGQTVGHLDGLHRRPVCPGDPVQRVAGLHYIAP